MRVVILLTALLVLFTCSQDQGDNIVSPDTLDRPTIGPPQSVIDAALENVPNTLMKMAGDDAATYDFEDLDPSCEGLEVQIPDPYLDLDFIDPPYFSVCDFGGSNILLPFQLGVEVTNIRFELTRAPADTVSIMAFDYSGYAPTLIVYDENWTVLGQTTTQQINTWETLELIAPAGTQIKYVGLTARQNSSIWDNLTVKYVGNTPPVALAGDDISRECEGNSMASITLDGSASYDEDNDPLTYAWFRDGNLFSTEVSPTLDLPLGDHLLTLVVDDGRGATDSDEVVVSVVDSTPPSISMILKKTTLKSRNHKMVLVARNVSASDLCCDVSLEIDVSSDESVNGEGDGNTDPDWIIKQNDDGSYNIWLRAERSGKGDGRTYTITATAEDCAGNVSTEVAEVDVPKNSKGKKHKKGGKGKKK